MTSVLLLISYFSIGQNNTTDYQFIEATATNTTIELSYSDLNKSIAPLPKTFTSKKNIKSKPFKKNSTYSESEWEKIKRQIRKNKSKVYSDVYFAKKTDTIYIDIPVNCSNSRISDL